MKVVNLVGDRLFLDYLITNYFNFTYENNHVKVDYNSYLDVSADIDTKIASLEAQLDESKQAPVQDEDFTMEIQQAISILNDLKNKLS
jgi:hypothetical protein